MTDLARHSPSATWRAPAVSVGLHAVLLLLFLAVPTGRGPRFAKLQVPGTALGNTTLVYYSPGGPPKQAHQPALHLQASPQPTLAALPTPAESTVPKDQTSADLGMGDSKESGLGDGDLRIALPTYSPTPRPSLSTMAAGATGDVVLDAEIDEQGHIRELKVLKGLGDAIDKTVLATVQQWGFTPAMRNGQPVPSGQELHFHYERG